MPMPASVSAADVIVAGVTLIEQGRAVSGGALRQVIGRGRPDRLMSLWRDQQPAPDITPPPPAAPALPPALDDALAAASDGMASELARLFGAAWATAHEVAQARIATEAEDARRRVEDLTAERDEALQALEEADARIAALEAERDAERTRADDAEEARTLLDKVSRESGAAAQAQMMALEMRAVAAERRAEVAEDRAERVARDAMDRLSAALAAHGSASGDEPSAKPGKRGTVRPAA